MRTCTRVLIAALLSSLAGGSFADTYSSSSSSVVTAGPRVSAPMAPAMNSSGLISDPQTIRSCLCLESQYESQAAVVSNKDAVYKQAAQEKASLDSMLASATPADMATIRQNSERRIMLQNRINETILPDLDNATAQYNQSVAAFQQSCGGKSYNADALAQAKMGLVCQGG